MASQSLHVSRSIAFTTLESKAVNNASLDDHRQGFDLGGSQDKRDVCQKTALLITRATTVFIILIIFVVSISICAIVIHVISLVAIDASIGHSLQAARVVIADC